MTEAHTGWQNEDYVDQPGYHGAERFNMNVYDCDYLHDDIEKVIQANAVATVVDGEETYKA
jgi:hypothetical protein